MDDRDDETSYYADCGTSRRTRPELEMDGAVDLLIASKSVYIFALVSRAAPFSCPVLLLFCSVRVPQDHAWSWSTINLLPARVALATGLPRLSKRRPPRPTHPIPSHFSPSLASLRLCRVCDNPAARLVVPQLCLCPSPAPNHACSLRSDSNNPACLSWSRCS